MKHGWHESGGNDSRRHQEWAVRECAYQPAPVTAAEYRAALRRHPAGVTIITLNGADGPVGFTATSFASLSLDPPLVCFNITQTSSSIGALKAADSIVIHLLGEHQEHLAHLFSRSAEYRFADESLWTTLQTSEPFLHGTLTWLRATIHQLIPAGDSTLVIGLVTHTHCESSKSTPSPLIYHDGAYLGTHRVDE